MMKHFLQNVMRTRMNDHEEAMSTLTGKTLNKVRAGRSGKRVDEATENSIKEMMDREPGAALVHIGKAHGVSGATVKRVLGLLKKERCSYCRSEFGHEGKCS